MALAFESPIHPIRRPIIAVALAGLAAACSHLSPYAVPQPEMPPAALADVDHRLLLIGDSGAPEPGGEPALNALAVRAAELRDRTTVVFLGDFVYETGMPEPSPLEGTLVDEILDRALLNAYESRTEAERRVRDQIRAVDHAGLRVVVIPGNHDWDQFGVGGWKAVLRLETSLAQAKGLTRAQLKVLPGGGCPGPVSLDAGAHGRLIVLDTQWWLETGEKPAPVANPTRCPYVTEADVQAALARELRGAREAGRAAIVAAHHPLRSNGPHGGYVDPLVHLFPLRMLGSYVPFFVRWVPLPVLGTVSAQVRGWRSPSPQDLSHPANRHMRRALTRAMRDAGSPPLLFVAGHDHSLQLFQGDGDGPRYVAVSGLGSRVKASEVRHDAATLFAHSNPDHPGFMQLDFLRDGRSRLAVVEWGADSPGGRAVYQLALEPASAVPRRGFLRRWLGR